MPRRQQHVMTKRGFTLTELMVALGVFLLLLGGIYLVMLAGQRSYYIGDARIQVDQEARRALDAVAKELRSAARSSILFQDVNGNGQLEVLDRLEFNVVTGLAGGVVQLSPTIRYYIAGLNNRQLLRYDGTLVRVMANEVQQVRITPQPAPPSTPTVLTIGITTQQTALTGHVLQEEIESQVMFRN